jgi:hypothetical protein
LGTPLYILCEELANLAGERIKGTPASGSQLTKDQFSCAALGVYENDFYNDWYGHFRSGPHKDTDFVVTDFTVDDAKNAIVKFLPALSEIVDVKDLFYLSQDYSPEQLISFINAAISLVEDEALEDHIDDTIIITSSTTYEYQVPSGIKYIDSIYLERATAGEYSQTNGLIDHTHWKLISGNKLWFNPELVSLVASRHLRLVGQRLAPQLVLDSDETNVNKSFLVYQALALLHQSQIRGTGADFEDHDSQMKLNQSLADRERNKLFVPGRGWEIAA